MYVLVDMAFLEQDTVDLRSQFWILSGGRIRACGLGDADRSCRIRTHGVGCKVCRCCLLLVYVGDVFFYSLRCGIWN